MNVVERRVRRRLVVSGVRVRLHPSTKGCDDQLISCRKEPVDRAERHPCPLRHGPELDGVIALRLEEVEHGPDGSRRRFAPPGPPPQDHRTVPRSDSTAKGDRRDARPNRRPARRPPRPGFRVQRVRDRPGSAPQKESASTASMRHQSRGACCREPAPIARSGLAMLAPEPHRTTRQPAVEPSTEPAICAGRPKLELRMNRRRGAPVPARLRSRNHDPVATVARPSGPTARHFRLRPLPARWRLASRCRIVFERRR